MSSHKIEVFWHQNNAWGRPFCWHAHTTLISSLRKSVRSSTHSLYSTYIHCALFWIIKVHKILVIFAVQNLKKKELHVLYLFSVPHDLFWPDIPKSLAKISQRPENPEGLVKITYGIVASSLFKRAGNSNWENLNCALLHYASYAPGVSS